MSQAYSNPKRNAVHEVCAARDAKPCWTPETGWIEPSTFATPKTALGNRLDIFDPLTGLWLWRRADYCVHPERDWCDCDWCRLRSSFVSAAAQDGAE